MLVKFDSHGADSDLKKWDGFVGYATPLDEDKYDKCETGPMFHVSLDKGVEFDAFLDELTWL